MLAIGSWMVGCCILAQVADETTRPEMRGPRLVPKRGAPAARFDPQAEPEEATGRAAPPPSSQHLLNQIDPAAHPERSSERGMERVGGGPRKLRPPGLLADAISSPRDGRLKGHPIALVEVLSKAGDRAGQIKAATEYWRLAIAQAQYHFALSSRDRLARWTQTRHKMSTLAESQLASAEAAVDDAEFKVLKAGAELGALAGAPDGDHVPWAVDRPHVGAYDSKYEQLFAGQNAPARLRLIHRTLPISRRSIDVHCEAVAAATDALEATEEEYRQGTAEYLSVAEWFDRLAAEQRSFLQSVLRYNEDIAVYAFNVAPAEADAALLASMLIRRPAQAKRAAGEESSSGALEGRTIPGEGAGRTFREEEGTTEDSSLLESGSLEPGFKASRPDRLRVLPVQGRTRAAAPGAARAGGAPAGGGHAGNTPTSHGGLYQGLLNAKPAVRAVELSQLLHWDRELPADSGEKTSLAAALERASGTAERRAVIEAYWTTRQSVARFQVLSELGESLTALRPHVLALHAQPGGSGSMLRLQAARQAAGAWLLDEHIRMLTQQFELTRLAGAPLERSWLLPSTVPNANAFDLSLRDPQGRKPAAHARTGSRVVVLHLELESQALAVVFADEHRAAVSGASEHQPASIDLALSAIERQFRETQTFLRALTDYNVAIADYALAALPAGTPAARLVEELAPGHPQRQGG